MTTLSLNSMANAKAALTDQAVQAEAWIFDLDNTLYPPECDLFGQIDQRMGLYIQDRLGLDPVTARVIQKRYFFDHGTTLAGLMARHRIDPHEFMHFVHDIDVAAVAPDARLDRALSDLPGRKLVFTNGSAAHAERVLARLGVARHFEGVFDIAAGDFVPKPEDAPYDRLIARFGINPARTVMIEDMARNLVPAAARGMTTVWLTSCTRYGDLNVDRSAIDHEIDDLVAWLEAMTQRA